MNGVRLVRLSHAGRDWRLGAVTPDWRHALLDLPAHPVPQHLASLARRGLWLAPVPKDSRPPRLAVMCCGQGSVWPGMGRALYDAFPAARQAMDDIASIADWDVLRLMDETELEKIGLTRWQQPYLFLLEYAQASYLLSLGLRPDVMSGHSLGELIALCLAGVYTPEEAWYIMDTRAQLVGRMEAEASRETGMMSVHAPEETIRGILDLYPDLLVSNYNTPTQFILSGSRETLLEARQDLRKRRVPAILLNVSLAFHHPSMRVLREHSLERLSILRMKPPCMPMMSNVTTGLYPDDAPSICEYIADLDENAVRWVECVRNMWSIHGVRHFVEFGPADTLCGLTGDIEEKAVCIPVGRKGTDKEVEGMRNAVARLYALGHLPDRLLYPVAGAIHASVAADASHATFSAVAEKAAVSIRETGPSNSDIEAVMPIIMEAAGLTRDELTPDMDLRHDLAIRSSRFPLIVHEAERRFHVRLEFEDIADVATIRDLARVLGRLQGDPSTRKEEEPEQEKTASPARTENAARPLLRYTAFPPAATSFQPTAFDPAGAGLPLAAGDVLLVAGTVTDALPAVLEGLAPWRCTFLLSEHVPETTRRVSSLGAVVRTIVSAAPSDLPGALKEVQQNYGRVDGLLYFIDASTAPLDETFEHLITACSPGTGIRYAAFIAHGSFPPVSEEAAFLLRRFSLLPDIPRRLVLLSDDLSAEDITDLAARELLRSTETAVLLTRVPPDDAPADSLPRTFSRERSALFPLVFPLASEDMPTPHAGNAATVFVGAHHFSWYGDPWLQAAGLPDGTARAPETALVECLLEAAAQSAPWLQLTGVADIVFAAPLECMRGVTREARITALAQDWSNGGLTRSCAVRLEARDVTANGRRRDSWTCVCTGKATLSCPVTALETPPPLWTPGTGPAATETIADAPDLQYCFPMPALQALLQLALRTGNTVNPSSAAPYIARLGQLHFSQARVRNGALRVELGGGPEAGQKCRFHGQVVDMQGVVRMTVQDICLQIPPDKTEPGLFQETPGSSDG